MSRFSINFDNEEQYRNFIQSIKDEVMKELPKKKNVNPTKMATIWEYMKGKVDELEMSPDEDASLKQALSTILRFGFKSWSVHFLPDHEFKKVKPYIDELFNSILKLREIKRPIAYKEYWKIKLEKENE